MNEDYLWDRSGPPDPEIVKLEEQLAPFRHRGRAMQPQPKPRAYWRWAAAAAALIAGVVVWRASTPPPEPTAWQVDRAAGPAQIGRKDATASMRVKRGDVMRTGTGAELELLSDDVGRVELGPQSEMRASSGKGLALRRGTLHAFIWARPGEFVVDTPSSRTVDLGCEYTLNVDSAGEGMVRVQMGWVAFQYQNRESFIPAEAQCPTHRASGPGIPFYEDAPEPLRASLARLERGDRSALGGILASARPRDGLTLWHLLTRTNATERGAVFDRFAQLVKLPDGVTRESIERLDSNSLDLCWDALNLENTEWWRGWERRWN